MAENNEEIPVRVRVGDAGPPISSPQELLVNENQSSQWQDEEECCTVLVTGSMAALHFKKTAFTFLHAAVP